MSRPSIDNSIYIDQFKELLSAEPGHPVIVDYRASKSFRASFICYLRQKDINTGAYFRSIRVSKDKTYFFKIDKTKKLNQNNHEKKRSVDAKGQYCFS